jgi:hypothetical protein
MSTLSRRVAARWALLLNQPPDWKKQLREDFYTWTARNPAAWVDEIPHYVDWYQSTDQKLPVGSEEARAELEAYVAELGRTSSSHTALLVNQPRRVIHLEPSDKLMDPDFCASFFFEFGTPDAIKEYEAAEKSIRDAGATSFEDDEDGITIVVPASKEADVYQAIDKIKAGGLGPDTAKYYSEFSVAPWNEDYQNPDDPQMPTKK